MATSAPTHCNYLGIICQAVKFSPAIDYSENSSYTLIRTSVRYRLSWKGDLNFMTKNEEVLLSMVRENDNPEQALEIAIGIISDFLMQPGSFEEQVAACLLVHA